MKDNFSHSSNNYLRFRPTYPKAFYDFVLSHVKERDRAWDCGTGNGQVAGELSRHFKEVYGTDVSKNQLQEAVEKDNIFYRVEDAEHASFPDNYFNLIVVAQAIHWFDFDAFYKQVFRTAMKGALFVAAGYGLIQTDHDIDRIINYLYKEITGDYWDAERRYIDENYLTIPFPFLEIEAPKLFIETHWKFDQLMGYLGTWSGIQRFKKATGKDALSFVESDLKKCWKANEIKQMFFPLLLRVGKVN